MDESTNYLEFCVECGTKNEAKELFCGNCGNHLEKKPSKTIENPVVSPQSNQATIYPVQPQPNRTPVYPIQSQPTNAYPVQHGNIDPGFQSFSKYPVKWSDAAVITLGGASFTYGIGVLLMQFMFGGVFGFVFQFVLFFGLLPIILGYILLRSYMVFFDMIKLAVVVALAVFLIFIVFFFLILVVLF